MLDGSTPAEALRQFDLKYGQFSGAEHSALGGILLEYRDWLDSHHWPHTADRLQGWARDVYPEHSVPGSVESPARLARGSRETTTLR